MTDVAVETYFDKECLGASLWYGLAMINALGGLGSWLYLPSWFDFGYISDSPWNNATNIAWYWMVGG